MAIIKAGSLPLETQIRFLIGDIEKYSVKLLDLEKQLDRTVEDEYLRNIVVEDITDAICRYTKIREDLMSKLEEYFTIEEQNGSVRNFVFRQVYKKLQK